MTKGKALGDYTLDERRAQLTEAMDGVGASRKERNVDAFEFHLKGVDMYVRIMLNQWDYVASGRGVLEEGHVRGSAEDVAGVLVWAVRRSSDVVEPGV